jgi:hypothetical protein
MVTTPRPTLDPPLWRLLAAWLPAQSWYRGGDRAPTLSRAGELRLEDPAGEVGIEVAVDVDTGGDEPVAYLLAMTFRGAPLDGARTGLIGTAEHSELGTRYFYDGTHDPVCVAQLLALVQGQAAARSPGPPDEGVTARPVVPGVELEVTACAVRSDGPDGTTVRVSAMGAGPVDCTNRDHQSFGARGLASL